jgi:hypothetical protein
MPLTGHELIASDAHWQGPAAPLEGRLSAAWLSHKNFYDEPAKHVGSLVVKMQNAFAAYPIAEGDTIAQPTEGSKRLIRVIQDTRLLGLASPLTFSLDFELNNFNQRAEEIEADDALYMGSRAAVWAPYTYWRNAKVLKEVYYLTYNSGDKYLFGLRSDRFSQYQEDGDKLSVPNINAKAKPKMTVGQVYRRGLSSRALTKIVSADIIEPGGKLRRRRQDITKPKPRTKEPKTAPRIGRLLGDNFSAGTCYT